MDTAFRILKDVFSNGLEEPIPVGGKDDQAHAILGEVQSTLEPYRKAKADAIKLAAQALDRKERSAANVVRAKTDAVKAQEKLNDLDAMVQARKAEKVKARVDQLASGAKAEPVVLNFDIDRAQRELHKRAEDAVEEANSVLAQFLEIDVQCGYDLLTAEANVSAADLAIDQAYLDGIAARMLDQNAVIRRLHAELFARVPSEFDRRPGTPKPSQLVERALALVEGVGDFTIPTNQMRGFDVVPAKWAPHPGPRVQTLSDDKYPMTVPGSPPRNADGIPTKI